MNPQGDLSVAVRLKADRSGLVGELRLSEREVQQFGRAMRESGEQARRTSTAQARLNRSTGETGALSREAAAGVRLLAGAYAAMRLSALVRDIISTNVEFDRLQASLVTVTGSQEAANAAFEELLRFTAQTPFQINEVVGAFIKLKALGLDPSIEALRSYGNTSSAMGKSLDQLIEAVADAATGEFERLKEFGIRASAQGDQIAFTFRGTTTVVERSSEAIQSYLRRIGELDFAGGMDLQMQTLGGRMSNLEDSASRLQRAFGERGLNAVVTDLTTKFTRLNDAMARNLQIGGGVLESLGAGIAELLHGTDLQRLGELFAEEIQLTERIRRIESGEGPPLARSSGVLETLRRRLEHVRAEIEGLAITVRDIGPFGVTRFPAPRPPGGEGGGDGGDGGGGPPPSVLRSGQQLLDQLSRQRALLEDDTVAARVLYETQQGGLQKLDQLMKDRLLGLAREIDAHAAAAEAHKQEVAFEEQEATLQSRLTQLEQEQAQERRSRLEERVENLRTSLQSELEAERERHERGLELLDAAQRQRIRSLLSYDELRERLERDHAARVSEIRGGMLRETQRQSADAARAARELGLSFSSAFEDAIVGGKELSSVLQGLGQDIIRITARRTVTEPLANLLTSALRGFGFHGGGVVGLDGGRRALLPAALWAGAPRLHAGGLAADEVPAILQRGEGVFTEAQMRALGRAAAGGPTVIVNVSAGGGSGVEVQGAGRANELGRAIGSAVREVILREQRPGGLLARGP